MFSICGCGWRLRFWLRLRTTSTLKLRDGTAVGVGAEMEAGMGDGAATTQTSRITAWPPQNPGLGAKRRFEALEAIPVSLFGVFGATFQKWKMLCSLRAASYTINVFTQGFSSKVDFQGTLGSYSTSAPPIFIDFLPTNSSRKKRSPFHSRGGEGGEGWLAAWIWAVRSGRLGLGG